MLIKHIFTVNEEKFLFLPEKNFACKIENSRDSALLESKVESLCSVNNKDVHSNVTVSNEGSCVEERPFGVFLHVANDCDARCVYCFAHQGSYGKARELISESTVYNSLETIYKKKFWKSGYYLFWR